MNEKDEQREYGVCRFCGQTKILAQPMPTQEQADEYATQTCSCDPAKAVRRRKRETETIQQMFGEYAPTVVDLLQQVVDLIRDGLLESGTSIKLEENVLQGGYGLQVTAHVHQRHPGVRVMNVALPDMYVEHGNV